MPFRSSPHPRSNEVRQRSRRRSVQAPWHMTTRPSKEAAAHSWVPQGSTLKQAHVTVGPLQGRSRATHFGSSGGRQQLPDSDVPLGQWPASGIKQVPGPGGWTHASCGPHVIVPHRSEPSPSLLASGCPASAPPLPPAPASVQTGGVHVGAQVREPSQETQH